MNTSNTGSTVTTEPASISSVSCTCSPDNPASATGRVYFALSVSTTNGQRKSFHVDRNVKIASVVLVFSLALGAPAQEKTSAEQLFRLRFQVAMGQNDGVKKLRQLRKEIAQIKTIAREREMGIRGATRDVEAAAGASTAKKGTK